MIATRVPHPMPMELVELLSERLLLISDPTRIRILDELRGGERTVQSIADQLPTTQQNVSGHLRLLRAAGVVTRRPAGRQAFYNVSDQTIFEVWVKLMADLETQLR